MKKTDKVVFSRGPETQIAVYYIYEYGIFDLDGWFIDESVSTLTHKQVVTDTEWCDLIEDSLEDLLSIKRDEHDNSSI